jgi:hypothetical protein
MALTSVCKIADERKLKRNGEYDVPTQRKKQRL